MLNAVVNITCRLSILKLSGLLLVLIVMLLFECVGCLKKFHGEEEIWALPVTCDDMFQKICVDKWILYPENMTRPLCRVCLFFLRG